MSEPAAPPEPGIEGLQTGSSLSSVAHVPNEAMWRFDQSVVACFDDMLRRSIPLYLETLALLVDFALLHLRAGDTVVDLGVATGGTLRVLLDATAGRGLNNLRLIGVDESADMLREAARHLPESTELIQADLAEGVPYRVVAARPRVIFATWTSTFVPIEHRSAMFSDCRRALASREEGAIRDHRNGCLLVADKLRGQTSRFQTDIVRLYHAWKERNGYSRENIDRKAKALRNVLVPNDAPTQKRMIEREGFDVEEVSRYLGFAAWYCLPR